MLPPALAVLTGRDEQGVCLIARDGVGRVVSCAGAAAFMRPEHAQARSECWWGMLATDPGRRGARLSLLLGARAILIMRGRYGFGGVTTGVAPGSAPSEETILSAADPTLVAGGRMTK